MTTMGLVLPIFFNNNIKYYGEQIAHHFCYICVMKSTKIHTGGLTLKIKLMKIVYGRVK